MINALLVFWSRGWAEITDPANIAAYGRREATLGLGAVQSIEEVTRIAVEQLRLYGRPLVEISADLEPMMPIADRPYRAFKVGDIVSTVPGPTGPTPERVVEMTVQEDENGEVTYAPTFRDLIIEAQEAFTEQLKKMANGTLGGSPAATPLSSVAVNSTPDCCPPSAFGDAGTLEISTGSSDVSGGESLPYVLAASATVVRFEFTPGGWPDGLVPTMRLIYTDGGDTVLAELDPFTGDSVVLSAPVVAGGHLRFLLWAGEVIGPFSARAVITGTGADEVLTWVSP